MTSVVRGVVWIAALVGVCVAPLVFALIGATQPGQGFLTDFSVALGFVGLALMGVEFVLVARVRRVAEPFGTDAVIDLHRYLGGTGLLFVLVHVALSADWRQANPFTPSDTPPLVVVGGVAVVCLLALGATSVWRRGLRLSYEVWQALHTGLAVVAVVAAVVHVILVDHYVDTAWKRALWSLMALSFVGLLVWVRLVRPWRQRRRPWVVESVTADRDSTTVLTMRPQGHDGMRFEPGQFAWITIDGSPFRLTSHPFSFSSSAEVHDQVQMAIKAVGDFTSSVAHVAPGTVVHLDGPHGVFSIDQYEGAGFGFVAGGVGIAPAMSMVETLADRGDARPVLLFVGARDADNVILADRIEALRARLDLAVVVALENPPEGWTGERGYLGREVFERHLPRGYERFQYFACGPVPMLDAVEKALVALGVRGDRIHTERFDWV
ncbi:MAG: ferric reductase-like transmembrane domain-containing protein [Nocardioides sp.]|uniref:ferredoxin reductase family protein n=1 Tax=Nocardioides sp. TaxID=35761 RepID=UPI003F0A3461